MGYIDLDLSHWPIVISTSHGEVSTEQMDSYMTKYIDTLRSRTERFIAIVDLRDAGNLDARQRQHMSTWMENAAKEIPAPQVATVLVFSSVLMRNVLTAVLWIFKPKRPLKVFATLDEAMAWSRQELGIKKVQGGP